MYHMLIVATALLIQYVFIYFTIGCFYKFYSKYEIDLKIQDEKIFYDKNDKQNNFEYTKLMIDDEF
jgi:hypothetical protein